MNCHHIFLVYEPKFSKSFVLNFIGDTNDTVALSVRAQQICIYARVCLCVVILFSEKNVCHPQHNRNKTDIFSS